MSEVVKKDGTAAVLEIQIHPLVIINISDHWTRTKVQTKNGNPRVFGALLGTQQGRNVEIENSYELLTTELDGLHTFDQEFLLIKIDQFKKVFPKADFLGWYSTLGEISSADLTIHNSLLEINENPLYLTLDTFAVQNPATKELPINVYESEIRIVNEKPESIFVQSTYKIVSGEAERIGVDHVAHTSAGKSEGSEVEAHLMGIQNAVKMLRDRVQVIIDYLGKIKEGSAVRNEAALRHIGALTNLLPAVDNETFNEEFVSEFNDALLTTYLASITKSSSNINELVEKFNVIHERGSRRRFY